MRLAEAAWYSPNAMDFSLIGVGGGILCAMWRRAVLVAKRDGRLVARLLLRAGGRFRVRRFRAGGRGR